MSARKLATSVAGEPWLKAVLRSPRLRALRGRGGLWRSATNGAPARCTCVPLMALVAQTPSKGGLAVVSFVVGTSRTKPRILALWKEFLASVRLGSAGFKGLERGYGLAGLIGSKPVLANCEYP